MTMIGLQTSVSKTEEADPAPRGVQRVAVDDTARQLFSHRPKHHRHAAQGQQGADHTIDNPASAPHIFWTSTALSGMK